MFEAINLTDENVDQYNIVGLTSRREQLYYISKQRTPHAGWRTRPPVGEGLETGAREGRPYKGRQLASLFFPETDWSLTT